MSTPKLISARAIFPQDRRLGILKKVAYYSESEKRKPVLINFKVKHFEMLLIQWFSRKKRGKKQFLRYYYPSRVIITQY